MRALMIVAVLVGRLYSVSSDEGGYFSMLLKNVGAFIHKKTLEDYDRELQMTL